MTVPQVDPMTSPEPIRPEPIRVVHVIDDLDVGGAPRLLVEFAEMHETGESRCPGPSWPATPTRASVAPSRNESAACTCWGRVGGRYSSTSHCVIALRNCSLRSAPT